MIEFQFSLVCPRRIRAEPDWNHFLSSLTWKCSRILLQRDLPRADHRPALPVGHDGQCPLTALALAEYPTPPCKGRRSAPTTPIRACRSRGDMAAMTFVVTA